ncbi:MAG: hypothetical protein IH825_01620 [Candidatus Marinimicrobia bacterium]|nr:hypothetical protein [Candidatus Neomarinimicrobiota bacterium]
MGECSFDKKRKMGMIDKMKKNNYIALQSKRALWVDIILIKSVEAT